MHIFFLALHKPNARRIVSSVMSILYWGISRQISVAFDPPHSASRGYNISYYGIYIFERGLNRFCINWYFVHGGFRSLLGLFE